MGGLATSPMPSRESPTLKGGGQNEVAHKWVGRLHRPCHLEGSQSFKARDKFRSGPQVGGLAS